MKFSISRDAFLKPLQVVSGAVERRHTLPILANVLIRAEQDQIRLTGTDLEVELVSTVTSGATEPGNITVPAKKLLDIIRSLPDGAPIEFSASEERATIRSGRSRFTLSTLPAADFPNIEDWESDINLVIEQGVLKSVMERTHFSMANQDVRYYLNGMLFETDSALLRTVATDGHRLAMSSCSLGQTNVPQRQVIVPRKGVMELLRLLDDSDAEATLAIGNNHIRIETGGLSFTSKLVDGRFPDYRRVLPSGGDKVVLADRDLLRQAFVRASILSNEKFRGVRLNLASGELCITANNPEQEQAEEVIEVDYQGDSLEIGFNVSYLLDVLNNIESEQVRITLADSNSSALVESTLDDSSLYVVMPMRL
ncbi:DNA polymerase III subunit beta [Idiomarina xiamenensis]|uniref:Beta sliding clamp n=1 Tax=Idiomarina xiamenensis 10-D-4 TaxID=740709 RepID=K2L0A6_9GAMM|nr:DNA polymerase III subunit beta [Idiomarina xiamenensis]EKE83365.1 DNA polymerase sliding clamp subunit [Idiomarina xiamenensis 10-D-4]